MENNTKIPFLKLKKKLTNNVLFMHLINLIVTYLYRKYGVPLHNFFSKIGPEVQATLNEKPEYNKIIITLRCSLFFVKRLLEELHFLH